MGLLTLFAEPVPAIGCPHVHGSTSTGVDTVNVVVSAEFSVVPSGKGIGLTQMSAQGMGTGLAGPTACVSGNGPQVQLSGGMHEISKIMPKMTKIIGSNRILALLYRLCIKLVKIKTYTT